MALIRFKDTEKLTRWVGYFLYIQVFVAVVSLASLQMEYQFVNNVIDGLFLSQDQLLVDATVNDQRQRVIAILKLAVWIISSALILRWIYQSSYNAHQFENQIMVYSKGWAVAWFFIPVAALWKPYQAIKEIWLVSHYPNDISVSSVSKLLPVWWLLFLFSNFYDRYLIYIKDEFEGLNELVRLNLFFHLSDALTILLSVLTYIVVNRIYNAQAIYINSLQELEGNA